MTGPLHDGHGTTDAKTCAAVGMAGNVLLTVGKFVAGILAGSTALLADAVHSLTDVVATAVAYVGIRIAEKPPDHDHHYGHGKAEAIAAAVVAGIILATGLFLCGSALYIIMGHHYRVPDALALVVVLISMLVKEALYRYTIRVARRTNSPALHSAASDHRSDVLASFAALAGVAGARLGWDFLDPSAAILIGFVILHMGYDLMTRSVNQLMAGVPPGDLGLELLKTVYRTERVLDVRDLRIQSFGAYVNVAVSVAVHGKLTVEQGHDIAHAVEDRIKGAHEWVRFVEVHIEPHRGGAEGLSVAAGPEVPS